MDKRQYILTVFINRSSDGSKTVAKGNAICDTSASHMQSVIILGVYTTKDKAEKALVDWMKKEFGQGDIYDTPVDKALITEVQLDSEAVVNNESSKYD